MGYNDNLEQQAQIDRQGPSPVYGAGQKGITIPANTNLADYIDNVSGEGFAKDSDLVDGSIDAIFNTVQATINGTGTNFKIGDDAYIGDQNRSNTVILHGVQDANAGYLQFGSGSLKPSIGFGNDGAFPAIGSSQAVTGSMLVKSAHLYFFNGGASNNGWSQII